MSKVNQAPAASTLSRYKPTDSEHQRLLQQMLDSHQGQLTALLKQVSAISAQTTTPVGSTIKTLPGAAGPAGPPGVTQPAGFAYVSNPGTVVVSTTSGNVVDTRAVLAGALAANQYLEATVRVFLTGVSNTKNLLVGIDADLSNALTAVFLAAETGIVEFVAQFLIAATGNVHLLVSRTDFNSQFGRDTKRGTVSVNIATTPFHLVTQAWVTNAADSITIDSVSWALRGRGL